jgi:hypothetical protein
VHDDRSVEEMAGEVLMRQAKARADRTGESIEEALEAVLNTEAGTQLRELRDSPRRDEQSVEEWQVGMAGAGPGAGGRSRRSSRRASRRAPGAPHARLMSRRELRSQNLSPGD